MKDILKNKINKLAQIYFRRRPQPGEGIFLLGHDRAGTTWVGNTLSLPKNIIYLHEPINETASRIGDWNAYNQCLHRGDSNKRYAEIFDNATRGIGVRELRLRELIVQFQGRARVVIKETGGMLCGEWFEERYGGQIVLLIRHPAPTIMSNIRMGEANAGNWLQQLSLQDKIMDSLTNRQKEWVRNGKNEPVWRQFALVYCLRYGEALRQLKRNPCWIYCRYEDICARPESQFRELFNKLRLEFTEQTRQIIREKTTNDDSSNFFGTERNSQRQLKKWKKRISQEQESELRAIMEVFEFPEYGDTNDWV